MGDQRAAEGVDHLQTAALEMIEAARAFLDVLEDAVGDRDKMVRAADLVAGLLQTAGRAGAGVSERGRNGSDGNQVEHIAVS